MIGEREFWTWRIGLPQRFSLHVRQHAHPGFGRVAPDSTCVEMGLEPPTSLTSEPASADLKETGAMPASTGPRDQEESRAQNGAGEIATPAPTEGLPPAGLANVRSEAAPGPTPPPLAPFLERWNRPVEAPPFLPSVYRPPPRPIDEEGGGWLAEHFRAYRQRTVGSFLWRITLEGLLISLGMAMLLTWGFNAASRTDLDESDLVGLFGELVLSAPIIETLFLQVVPIALARMMGLSFGGQIAMSMIPFALLHFPAGVGSGIAAGVVGGFYFAFTYAHWRNNSLWTAYWTTALSHALHNLFAWCMIGLGI